jgi:hypothetical protein
MQLIYEWKQHAAAMEEAQRQIEELCDHNCQTKHKGALQKK